MSTGCRRIHIAKRMTHNAIRVLLFLPSFTALTALLAKNPFRRVTMNEDQLLQRITVNPEIFGGKPIIRGRRLAVEHVLGMLAAGDDMDTLLEGYPWLERDDILACLAYAYRLVEHERVEPLIVDAGA